MTTFATDFPASVQMLFAQTQAFAVPGTPTFCEVANDRICVDYEANYSCCCHEEMAAWQSCLVENVFSQELGLPEPCQSTCGASTSDGGSGGFPVAMVAGVVVAVLAAVILGWYCWRRRRGGGAKLEKDLDARNTNVNDIEEGGSTSTSVASPENNINGRDKVGMVQPSYDDQSESSIYSNDDEKDHKEPTPALVVVKQEPSKSSGGMQKHDHDDGYELQERKSMAATNLATSKARDKKHAIEAWNESRKQGSSQSLGLFLPEGDDSSPLPTNDSDSESARKGSSNPTRTSRSSKTGVSRKSSKSPTRTSRSKSSEGRQSTRSKESRPSPEEVTAQLAALSAEMEAASATDGTSNRDGPGVGKPSVGPKKISSRDLKKLMKERDQSAQRASTLEIQKAEIEDHLTRINTEAETLRREFAESQHRIEQLEDENHMLRIGNASSLSGSSRDLSGGADGTEQQRRFRRTGGPTKHANNTGDEQRPAVSDRSREGSSRKLQSSSGKSRRKERESGDRHHNNHNSFSSGSHHSIGSFRDPATSKVDELAASWHHESLLSASASRRER
jgi:hypothetical protein